MDEVYSGKKFIFSNHNLREPPPGNDDERYFDPEEDLCLWSSTMKRAVETAENIPCSQFVQYVIFLSAFVSLFFLDGKQWKK